MIKKYRKKPRQVEALEFIYSKEGIEELRQFCGSALGHVSKARHMSAVGEAEIKTLEDGAAARVKHIATEGDYIIKGIHGEFYPCKPDIFHKSYEEV